MATLPVPSLPEVGNGKINERDVMSRANQLQYKPIFVTSFVGPQERRHVEILSRLPSIKLSNYP